MRMGRDELRKSKEIILNCDKIISMARLATTTYVIFIVIFLILLLTVTIFCILAASKIRSSTNSDTDVELKSAHSVLTWMSVIGSLAVVTIIGTAMWYAFSKKDHSSDIFTSNTAALIVTELTGLLVLAVGIGATIAAVKITKSVNYSNDTEAHGAHSDATWAAVLGILSFVLYLTYLIILEVYIHKNKLKAEEIAEQKASTARSSFLSGTTQTDAAHRA